MTIEEFDNWLTDSHRRALVMGVLNVTPDSFSDGGKFVAPPDAVAHAMDMIGAGADVVDIGGESTRPGAERVPVDEQIRRVVPVIAELVKRTRVPLSIDTTLAPVAAAALKAGAALVNDVSAGRDDAEMFPLVAARRTPIVLMHMKGEPATMQKEPAYADVLKEVSQFLRQRLEAAVAAGVGPSRVLFDPGIGFGKTADHNLELLKALNKLAGLGPPVLIGTSRKSFVGKVSGEDEASGRLFGTAASVAWAVANGAAMVRVHDVGPMVKVVRMIAAIRRGTVA